MGPHPQPSAAQTTAWGVCSASSVGSPAGGREPSGIRAWARDGTLSLHTQDGAQWVAKAGKGHEAWAPSSAGQGRGLGRATPGARHGEGPHPTSVCTECQEH